MSNYRVWAEINKKNLLANVEIAKKSLSKLICSEPEIMAVIKADAYGHGLKEIAHILKNCVNAFGVANIGEAEIAQKVVAGKKKIYLLSPALPTEIDYAIENNFILVVSGEAEFHYIRESADRLNKRASVFLMLDTGMGRAGFLPKDFLQFAKKFTPTDKITIDSVASHFPSADTDAEFTESQIKLFAKILATAKKHVFLPDKIHIANSAGTMAYDFSLLKGYKTLLRPGLMLYGSSSFSDSKNIKSSNKLKPVMTLKARLILIRNLPKGWGISYGSSFVAKENITVGLVSIGYGDGYPRSLSNRNASVLIGGTRCQVLGTITMDMIVVNLSDFFTAKAKNNTRLPKVGDEVVIIGNQGKEEILANELAKKANTISWEIFTSVTKRVKRIYV